MKKIIISVTNNLVTDQRVHKVCTTLHHANFEIVLVGRRFKNSKPIYRNYTIKRFSLFFNTGFLFYAEYNIRLFFFLFFSKKDILLSNDLDTLLANFLVSNMQGKKLVYDSHELFTEVPELVNRKKIKFIWVTLEKWMLPHLKNCYTVCESIALFYKKKYGTSFKVIKNLPVKKEVIPSSFPFDSTNKKIILYQGAVNMGRGLELMITVMNYLNNHLFIIIGTGTIKKLLEEKVRQNMLQEKVKFLGVLEPLELEQITPLAHLGISLEEDIGLNYKFALPNKIFDYIQATIPILISDLPEMKPIVLNHQVGGILTERTPKSLANQIEELLRKDFSVALKKAKQKLIWEQQEEMILNIFKNLM